MTWNSTAEAGAGTIRDELSRISMEAAHPHGGDGTVISNKKRTDKGSV